MQTFKQFLTEALNESYSEEDVSELYGQDIDDVLDAYKTLKSEYPSLYGKLDLIKDADDIQQLSLAFCGAESFNSLSSKVKKLVLDPKTIEALFGPEEKWKDEFDEITLDVMDDLEWSDVAEACMYLHGEF